MEKQSGQLISLTEWRLKRSLNPYTQNRNLKLLSNSDLFLEKEKLLNAIVSKKTIDTELAEKTKNLVSEFSKRMILYTESSKKNFKLIQSEIEDSLAELN